MEDEHWTHRDFTQIKPRRPEGTTDSSRAIDTSPLADQTDPSERRGLSDEFSALSYADTLGYQESAILALPTPSLLVGYQDDWLKTSSGALHLWEKAPFEPYALAKQVNYHVICLASEPLVTAAVDFFQQLSSVYEVCRLGIHMPCGTGGGQSGPSASSSKQVLPGFTLVDVPGVAQSSARGELVNASNYSLAKAFTADMAANWNMAEYRKALGKVCKALPISPGSSSQREPDQGPCTVVYVVCPVSDPAGILETMVDACASLGCGVTGADSQRQGASTTGEDGMASSILGFSIPRFALQLVTAETIFKNSGPRASSVDVLKEVALGVYNKVRRIPRRAQRPECLQNAGACVPRGQAGNTGNPSVLQTNASLPGLWKDCSGQRSSGNATMGTLSSSNNHNMWEQGGWKPSLQTGLGTPSGDATQERTRHLYEPADIFPRGGYDQASVRALCSDATRDAVPGNSQRASGVRPEESCEDSHAEHLMPFAFLWPGKDGEAQGREGDLQAVEDSENCRQSDEQEIDECERGATERRPSEECPEEFAFSSMPEMSSTAVVERLMYPAGISPADELFFKGQLLPLHLPPRIQMVRKLSLDKQAEQLLDPPAPLPPLPPHQHRSEETTPIAHGSNMALSQAKFARLFQPKLYTSKSSVTTAASSSSSEAVSTPPPASSNSWWDYPRDQHEHTGYASASSHASFTSTDRDSSGDSSSSRDSSGSSQDCFDTGANHLDHAKLGTFLHNREVFSTHSACSLPDPLRSPSPGISTWLRPPFKWKVLFGAKKSLKQQQPTPPPGPAVEIHLAQENQNPGNSHPELNFASGDHRYYSDCSGELTHSGDLLLSSRAFAHGVHPDQEKLYYQRGVEKAKGYLNRYMKALQKKAGHGGSTTNTNSSPSPSTITPSNPAAQELKGSAHVPSPAISHTRTSQSFRFSPRDISLRMIKRPPQPQPQPPPPHGRRASTSSASWELHSAVQGAIAHCKESQSRNDDALAASAAVS